MNQAHEKIDPLICPLCTGSNACLNLSTKDIGKSCWCNDPAIEFPKGLLSLVSTAVSGKACICKTCALKYQEK